jgi:hypothetical protein
MVDGGFQASDLPTRQRTPICNLPTQFSQQKREANTKVVELLLAEEVEGSAPFSTFVPLKEVVWVWKWFILMGLLVDLIGIEPMTSSMPFFDDHATY